MSAFSCLYFYCLTALCLLSTHVPIKAWPQAPQDAVDVALTQMNAAKDTIASQIPGKTDHNMEENSTGRPRRSAVMQRLKRQTDDDNEFYDENAIIIPDRVYPQHKDLGQHLREGFERLAESIQRTWNSLAKSMEQFVGNIRECFAGNQTSYNETGELTMKQYYNVHK